MLSVKSATFGSLENNCYLITDEKTNKSALIDCTEDSEKMMILLKVQTLNIYFLHMAILTISAELKRFLKKQAQKF